MKIILENFGPIRKVEFDLSKDLNVIFGENNIGKSYAITALYILLKHLLAEFGGKTKQHVLRLRKGSDFQGSFQATTDSLNFSSDSLRPSLVEEAVEKIRNMMQVSGELQEVDLSEPLATLLQDTFSYSIEELLTNSFHNCFGSIERLNNGSNPLSILIETGPFTISLAAKGDNLVVSSVKLPPLLFQENSLEFDEGHTEHHFTNDVSQEHDQSYLLGMMNGLLLVFRVQLLSVAHKLYFLPASRSGLYQALSNLSPLFAELSKSRSSVTREFKLPSLSEPVADYFIQLSSIPTSADVLGVGAIAQQMEQELLGGEVGFNEQTKKLYFRQRIGNREMDMDLSFSSSMISEVAPIVAHIKYILPRDIANQPVNGSSPDTPAPVSLLFIEEPEAHLHPKVQVKLMEFFARLSKHNVKVVMTSHSNYMFNKLSNLLLTDELEPEKVGSYLMRATPEGSVMDAFAMRAEEEGIADENFVDVAEQLYNERLAAYDKQGAKA